MIIRHPIALTVAGFIAFGLGTPAFAAPEGVPESAATVAPAEATAPAQAAAPAEAAAPAVTTEAARPAQPRVRQARTARPVVRTVQPRVYTLASSAPVGCRSFQCLTGGTILLGVGF